MSLAAFCFSVRIKQMNRLSGPTDDVEFEQELRQMYPDNTDDEFVNELVNSNDRITYSLVETSIILDTLVPIDEKRRVEIDKSLVIIGDTIASCERIFTSPVPLVYTRHTSRFLTAWMICLPFGIYDEILKFEGTTINSIAPSGWPIIPVTAVLALFLFGIEELSIQLEEPFSILPMSKFCNEIKQSTQDIIDFSYQSKKRQRQRQRQQRHGKQS